MKTRYMFFISWLKCFVFLVEETEKNVSIRHRFQYADSEKSSSDVNAGEPLRDALSTYPAQQPLV